MFQNGTMFSESLGRILEVLTEGCLNWIIERNIMNTSDITKKLNILVVEDTFNHQQAARLQLADHNVTIVGGYKEGNDLLEIRVDYDKYYTLPEDVSMEEKERICATRPNWDVVLLDLMLPASMCGVSGDGEKFEGQEMPIGTILAFLAIKSGCKNVAVVTDVNHHKHPASAAFDSFGGGRFQVGDANIFLTNYGTVLVDAETFELIKYTEGWNTKYPSLGNELYQNAIYVKPWKNVLEKVLGTYVARRA